MDGFFVYSPDTSTSSLGYITSPQLKIVAICSDHIPPLAVIYDKGDHTHTLWSINEATTEVSYNSINRYNSSVCVCVCVCVCVIYYIYYSLT